MAKRVAVLAVGEGKIGLWTATGLTISSMVGTGVFTSLGYQLYGQASVFSVVLLWLLGGLTAFCGAVCYYDLIRIFPDSGGETYFVAKLYGKRLSMVVAALSIVFGFAAPIALSALAFGSYAHAWVDWEVKAWATAAIVGVLGSHLLSVTARGMIQSVLSVGKLLLLGIFILLGISRGNQVGLEWIPSTADVNYVFTTPFIAALMFVHYAYSGWNTSIYIFRELRNERTVYWSLLVSVVTLTVLYTALNIIFLLSADIDELRGVTEVGKVVATKLLGVKWGMVLSSLIGILLVANVSAMMWAGSRVSMKMVELITGKRADQYNLILHVLLIAVVSLMFVSYYDFEKLLLITSCILSLVSVAVVAGLFSRQAKKRGIAVLTWKTRGCAVIYISMMASSSLYVLTVMAFPDLGIL
jgi:APA family basic amino acid/polyamine antiporter